MRQLLTALFRIVKSTAVGPTIDNKLIIDENQYKKTN